MIQYKQQVYHGFAEDLLFIFIAKVSGQMLGSRNISITFFQCFY